MSGLNFRAHPELYRKCTAGWSARTGSEVWDKTTFLRLARAARDGGRPPIGGKFRQPDTTPFTPVFFGLRLLRQDGHVLLSESTQMASRPPSAGRPCRSTAAAHPAAYAAACRRRRIGDRKIGGTGAQVHERKRVGRVSQRGRARSAVPPYERGVKTESGAAEQEPGRRFAGPDGAPPPVAGTWGGVGPGPALRRSDAARKCGGRVPRRRVAAKKKA